MCLILYLGTNAPLPAALSDPPEGGVGAEPDPAAFPAALSAKRYRYAIADRHEGRWYCSCVFLDGEDDARTVPAFAGLRDIAAAAQAADPDALLYGVWAGSEDRPPAETVTMPPAAFAAGEGQFDSADPDIRRLFRLDPTAAVPRFPKSDWRT